MDSRSNKKRGAIMAVFTEKYKLKKPGQEDYYDIKDQNYNMDILEEALTIKTDFAYSNIKINNTNIRANEKEDTFEIVNGENIDFGWDQHSKSLRISANKYIHPDKHEPEIINQNINNRFVSDKEKATWNGKIDKTSIVQNAVTADINKIPSAAVAKDLQDQINSTITQLGKTGTYYSTEEVNTNNLYANNWYDIIGTLELPPGSYLVIVNLQVTLKEIKLHDLNINDFYFNQANTNSFSMIVSKTNSMRLMIKGIPSVNIKLDKSSRYNYFQAIRIA